jgi:cytochrome P450
MYVAVMMVRETMQESKLGDSQIPQGQKVVVCSYTSHMDERNWNIGTEKDSHPVREFWGKRFLEESESSHIFSLAGTEGKWLPYGMGERMCPGRHFAKHQMMLTFAYLTAHFDIDLAPSSKRRPAVDINHFGFGTLPPSEPVPFRLRKSASASAQGASS